MAEDSRQAKMAKAQRTADKRLREAHGEEWNRLMTEEAKARGIDWKPRLSPEQKRREQFKALLAEDPSLASLVQGGDDDETATVG